MKVTYGASPERRLLTVAVAVFLLAAAAGIVVWIVVGTAGSDSHPRAATTTRTVTVTKAAPTTSTRSQLTQWYIGVQNSFDAITGDQSAIQGAADPTKLRVACHDLKQHVVTFEAAAPAPEAGVRNDIARMLDAYSTAATQCLGGNLKSAAAHVVTGSTWLGRAAERIKQLENR